MKLNFKKVGTPDTDTSVSMRARAAGAGAGALPDMAAALLSLIS